MQLRHWHVTGAREVRLLTAVVARVLVPDFAGCLAELCDSVERQLDTLLTSIVGEVSFAPDHKKAFDAAAESARGGVAAIRAQASTPEIDAGFRVLRAAWDDLDAIQKAARREELAGLHAALGLKSVLAGRALLNSASADVDIPRPLELGGIPIVAQMLAWDLSDDEVAVARSLGLTVHEFNPAVGLVVVAPHIEEYPPIRNLVATDDDAAAHALHDIHDEQLMSSLEHEHGGWAATLDGVTAHRTFVHEMGAACMAQQMLRKRQVFTTFNTVKPVISPDGKTHVVRHSVSGRVVEHAFSLHASAVEHQKRMPRAHKAQLASLEQDKNAPHVIARHSLRRAEPAEETISVPATADDPTEPIES